MLVLFRMGVALRRFIWAECDGSLHTSDSIGEAKPVSYMKLGTNGYLVLETYGKM